MGRWIKLHERVLRSKIFRNDELIKTWIWCLIKASHEKCTVELKVGRGIITIDLKPGQFVYGREKASKDLQLPQSTVRNRIKKLEKQGSIKIYPHKTHSIIYITKWHIYQAVPEDDFVEVDGEIYKKKVSWVKV